jgi:hypothetical protein
MDKFQEDMFQVFERARRLCRTDSRGVMKQVFFDSVLLKFDKRLNCKKIKLLFVLDLCSQTLIQSLDFI